MIAARDAEYLAFGYHYINLFFCCCCFVFCTPGSGSWKEVNIILSDLCIAGDGKKDEVPAGAIAGGVIGGVVLCVVIAGGVFIIVWLFCRKSKKVKEGMYCICTVQLSSKVTFVRFPEASCTHSRSIPHAFWMLPAAITLSLAAALSQGFALARQMHFGCVLYTLC